MSTQCPCCGKVLGFGESYLSPTNSPLNTGQSEKQKIEVMEALLNRAMEQLGKWQEFYGAKNDPRLPPYGDLKLMEDVEDALRPNKD